MAIFRRVRFLHGREKDQSLDAVYNVMTAKQFVHLVESMNELFLSKLASVEKTVSVTKQRSELIMKQDTTQVISPTKLLTLCHKFNNYLCINHTIYRTNTQINIQVLKK